MEGRKESKYNLVGTCPECGKLIKVEHVISVDLVETGTTTKVEEKEDEASGNSKSNQNEGAEGADVRPADEKGPAGTASGTNQPADSGKTKSNKKAGGKHK